MKIPFLRHTGARITTYIMLLCCLSALPVAISLYTVQDSVDTEGAVELNAVTAHKELQEHLLKSLDMDLGPLMETWRTGYATQKCFEVPCGSCKAESTRSLSDPVLISQLQTLPTVIPIPYDATVKEGIATYIMDRSRLIRVILTLGDYYFSIMEEIFDHNGLPVELIYLTVAESALNPFAVSPAGTSGFWQFMFPTGRSLGLMANSLIDEHFDVYKSSEAVAFHLEQFYGLFDNWLLAIVMYNRGLDNVVKAIWRSGGKTTFWDVYPCLPRETRNYIPLFIRAYYACHYHNEHNICPQAQLVPLVTDTLVVQIPPISAQISQSTDTPTEQIRTLNLQYKRGVIPVAGSVPYTIRPPLRSISRLDEVLITLRRGHKEALSKQIAEAQEEVKQEIK